MIYTNCTTCGESHRFLTLKECEDKDFVKAYKNTPLTSNELDIARLADQIIPVTCATCDEKKPKKKKKAKKDDSEE